MILKRLLIKNFRCFERVELTELDRLAVLIGENDVGKTVLMEAIALLTTSQQFSERDIRMRPDGTRADKLVIEGEFQIEDHDTLPAEFRSGLDNRTLLLRKSYSGLPATEVMKKAYSDPRFDSFVGPEIQKALLAELGETPGSNEAKRLEQRDALVQAGTLKLVDRMMVLPQFNAIANHMPRIERISSVDYQTPDSMIQKTLQSVAASVITPKDPDTGEPSEIEELQRVRGKITERLNEEIKKAKAILSKEHSGLREVHVSPTIDFTRCVTTTNLGLDTGEGGRPAAHFGEGTKRRLWMGLLQWEREATRDSVTTSVMRLYDEPDVNLHYEAQRKLFANVTDLACDPSLRTQCFVATHSVTLIDRAPCESINLIRLQDDGSRSLARIQGTDDAILLKFFDEVARAVGLTNTVLLYERAFLVVEGESEEAALPILYRHLHGRSLLQDGIILVNLHTCSAWKSVMQVLLKTRLGMTVLLLDGDCKHPGSSGYLTVDSLTTLGCDSDFLTKQVVYIGTKEYEDAFDDQTVCNALNGTFPRDDGTPWDVAAIAAVRATSPKFSEDVRQNVIHQCVRGLRTQVRKPTIAEALAVSSITLGTIPTALIDLFNVARVRAGLVN